MSDNELDEYYELNSLKGDQRDTLEDWLRDWDGSGEPETIAEQFATNLQEVWIAEGSPDGWNPDDYDDQAVLFTIKAYRARLQAITRSAASTLGRKGGKSTSPVKQAAVRENGKKGGRPRKA